MADWWAEERDNAWWVTNGKESWRMVSKFNADSLVRVLNKPEPPLPRKQSRGGRP